jgi:hypothetical protein
MSTERQVFTFSSDDSTSALKQEISSLLDFGEVLHGLKIRGHETIVLLWCLDAIWFFICHLL